MPGSSLLRLLMCYMTCVSFKILDLQRSVISTTIVGRLKYNRYIKIIWKKHTDNLNNKNIYISKCPFLNELSICIKLVRCTVKVNWWNRMCSIVCSGNLSRLLNCIAIATNHKSNLLNNTATEESLIFHIYLLFIILKNYN